MSACEQAQDWETLSQALNAQAVKYEATAERAWNSGHDVSALEGWRRATDYFHYAQLRLLPSPEKQRLQARSRRSFSKLASLLNPQAVPIEAPFKSSLMPGFLRVVRPGSPCVILLGGLDSSKEVELCYFAETFLSRGNTVFFFDGPGQGELQDELPMTYDSESAVSAVIDRLEQEPSIDANRIGLFGVSFGGYLACRAAAADRRVKACISLGGFFDSRMFSRLPPLAALTFKRTFGLREDESLAQIAGQITLEPLRGKMDRPLFVAHGRDDHLIDIEQISAMNDWACGEKRVWIVEGAEHVCTNRFAECLPELGDWMSEQLIVARN